MVEALLYEKQRASRIRCNICQRRCSIPDNGVGYCYTRRNHEGKLFSLIYGKVSTMMISPIEKKPLFHFYPGSPWLSIGSRGCNFRCPGCQNWEIAHARPDAIPERNPLLITPEELVKIARDNDCLGISWTYNEPTIWFEYTLDGARLAKKQGLLTNYVTNGSITPEALDLIGPYLDSFRVDIKAFSTDGYRRIAHMRNFTGILETTKRALEKWGMHIEIVTNIIPGYNDDNTQLKDIASWIAHDLGRDTPWHVTQFVPHLKLSHLMPTSVRTLEQAREIGIKEGLNYVYLGNVWGHAFENTYCPGCGNLLIERQGFSISKNALKDGSCPSCGKHIPGKFSEGKS